MDCQSLEDGAFWYYCAELKSLYLVDFNKLSIF